MSTAAPTSPPPAALLARLKSETAHLHRRIEQVVPLLRPGFDKLAYRTYLGRLLGFQRPFEERLSASSAGLLAFGLDFAPRRRAGLLVNDLVSLGQSQAEVDTLPDCAALPAAASLAEVFGCLYVLEGSTLGGQVLLRRLGPTLDLTAEHGLRFLAGSGPLTGPMWKAFGAALGRFEAQGCDAAAVIRGACETFAAQMDWLAAGAPCLT